MINWNPLLSNNVILKSKDFRAGSKLIEHLTLPHFYLNLIGNRLLVLHGLPKLIKQEHGKDGTQDSDHNYRVSNPPYF